MMFCESDYVHGCVRFSCTSQRAGEMPSRRLNHDVAVDTGLLRPPPEGCAEEGSCQRSIALPILGEGRRARDDGTRSSRGDTHEVCL
jgi:hypothetical protein